jgi:imidazolonepropionase-like amidohydrolase
VIRTTSHAHPRARSWSAALLLLLLLVSSPVHASAAPPSTAPALDSARYVVLNHGRPAGEMLVVRTRDSLVVRYHHVDRNRGARNETRYRLAPDGRVVAASIWQLALDGATAPRGAPSDRFEITRDSLVSGASERTRRAVRNAPGLLYRLGGGSPLDNALLARAALASPGRTARLAPAGTLRAEVVADTAVLVAGRPQRLRLVVLHRGGGPPAALWLDERDELAVSGVAWFITVREGFEGTLPTLRRIETAYRDAQGAALARAVAPQPASAIAIVGGDVFDSERGVVLPRTTILVRGDRIVAVGPADSVAIPAGARTIDARGKTVIPGMWDMHTHVQLAGQSGSAPAQLANGITTVRDLAADIDVAVSHRDRANAGTILAPRFVLGGFIEGPLRWAGPTEVLVHTEADARAWVARYDSLGYRQIKLYNVLHPDLVPTIAEEARKRGLRLSGHVPRGITVPTAVRLGFDEINHAAFLFSTFYQDSLYLPMRAYSAVAAAVAPNIDVESAEMSAMIALLRERGTVIDGTFNLWMSARSLAAGARADSLQLRADANYLRLVRRLHDAGVTLVPGTDGSSYNDELELYERAGIPAPEVLRIATIVSARVMKDDRDYGSIAAGKVADLAIVDGRPHERVADLRKVRQVMRAGRLYDRQRLLDAVRPERQADGGH